MEYTLKPRVQSVVSVHLLLFIYVLLCIIITGQGILYDTFQDQNTKWLWLVNDIVTTMNSNNVQCVHLDYFQVM